MATLDPTRPTIWETKCLVAASVPELRSKLTTGLTMNWPSMKFTSYASPLSNTSLKRIYYLLLNKYKYIKIKSFQLSTIKVGLLSFISCEQWRYIKCGTMCHTYGRSCSTRGRHSHSRATWRCYTAVDLSAAADDLQCQGHLIRPLVAGAMGRTAVEERPPCPGSVKITMLILHTRNFFFPNRVTA